MAPILCITRRDWRRTWSGLAKRGRGVRESACIWAGELGEKTWLVKDVIFLDDFPGVKASALQHRTTPEASAALFSLLRERGLEIVADIHTHPAGWVDLSDVDRRHPIEFRPGLLALVLPDYAESKSALSRVGVHEYVGDGQWRRLGRDESYRRIQVRLWRCS